VSLTLLLRCSNLEETRTFYQSVLDFNVTDAAGTITVEKHGGKLIFTTQDLWENQPAFSGTIYFTVPDADGFFCSVKDKVNVAWPIQDMPYGSREFGIKDCNGYYLAFQQQL
jgi:predicted enzyme related to lactoylglutathione lyase